MTAFLDELAKNLARPMSRSRALRLAGGALVSGCGAPDRCEPLPAPDASTAVRPKAAGCVNTTARVSSANENPLRPERGIRLQVRDRKGGRGVQEEAVPGAVPIGNCLECCKEDEFCANSQQRLCCKLGERRCGPRCCNPNEECTTIRVGTRSERVCEKRCPQGQAWCGRNKCCPPKWNCANEKTGLCKRCRKNQEECEKKCCDKSTSRCCGKAGCCPKSRSCCVTRDKQRCCPSGTKCAIPILAGDIGVKPGTDAICCRPQARLNNSPKLAARPHRSRSTAPASALRRRVSARTAARPA